MEMWITDDRIVGLGARSLNGASSMLTIPRHASGNTSSNQHSEEKPGVVHVGG